VNGAEKSGLATIYADFSTSAAMQPSLEMTTFLSFLQSIFNIQSGACPTGSSQRHIKTILYSKTGEIQELSLKLLCI
jgi:hypothetical protein